jgi:excisionase family DNA binding protein
MNEEKIERLLIRPAEAFEIVGVSRSTGYQLISAGEIPAIKINRSLRIPVAQLRAWVERKVREKEGSGLEKQ